MPELPEVETIRRGLSEHIVHQKIRRITVKCDKSFQGNREKATNATITGLRRFGKALIIDLDNHNSLMIHLRMTGQLIYDSAKALRYAAGHPSDNFIATLPNRQTRVILELAQGTLYFNDQRKFGFIKVLPTAEVENDPFIQKLAPEPWSMDSVAFHQSLHRHPKSPIKAVILDQTVICGLGNIYADEALFATKIHPERKCSTITKQESIALLENAKKVMETSIASGGSTMRTYVKANGERGDYLDQFAQVFGKQNQLCPRCKQAKIVKIKVAGRGTHLCPHCQKKGTTDA